MVLVVLPGKLELELMRLVEKKAAVAMAGTGRRGKSRGNFGAGDEAREARQAGRTY